MKRLHLHYMLLAFLVIFLGALFIGSNQDSLVQDNVNTAIQHKKNKVEVEPISIFQDEVEAAPQKQIVELSKKDPIHSIADLPVETDVESRVGQTTKKLNTYSQELDIEDQAALFTEERVLHERNFQLNPITGTIPSEEVALEKEQALNAPKRINEDKSLTGVSFRGPSNFGGRTRALAYDIGDATGNTILAGGISGGVFKTTNGGTSWGLISDRNDQHSVTAIVQDPRVGFSSTWYYATGESSGNSASAGGAFYVGFGIFQSIDNGVTWTLMSFPLANVEASFDRRFDLISRLTVHPTTGDLVVAALGRIYRFDISTSSWVTELTATGGFGSTHLTDIVVTPGGRLYAAFSGVTPAAVEGVWTCNNATGAGAGTWTRIATNGSPGAWNQTGRAVLGLAPSNPNILYVLYVSNAATPSPGDSDLWRWDQSTTTWTTFAAKIPNEPGGSAGNDPFNTQGGYDMAVAVKPDNENFVVISSTNAYKITNINTGSFVRIGGYDGPSTYAIWNNGGGAEHHPDVHTLVFNPFNPNTLLTGSDGGVHQTIDLNAGTVGWINLNNDYETYQFYHIGQHPTTGNNGALGGAQDNGTMAGGTSFGFGDNTTQSRQFSGDGCASSISNADACQPFYMSTQNGNMVRDCPTFATITPTGSSSSFVTYFHLDQVGSNTIYYAGQNRIYRTNSATTVNTGSWTNLGVLPGTDFAVKFATTHGAYSAVTSRLYIGGDEGHVFRLDDPRGVGSLASIVDITPPGATTGFPSVVAGVAVHPTNNDIVMVTYTNYGIPSIFLTTNATAGSPTWTLVEGNISAHSVRTVAITEVLGTIVYFVGTAKGLYSNQNPGVDNWVQEASTTIGFSLVTDLEYRHADLQLLIGTHGGGMYDATVNDLILPVELTSFSGMCSEAQVSLEWETASEHNNDYFSVERSKDGINYAVVATITGAGSSINSNYYSFEDREAVSLEQQGYYYRIKQTDYDGINRHSSSIYVSLDCKELENVIAISPNPSSGIFIVQSRKKIVSLEVFNAQGQRIIGWQDVNDLVVSLNLEEFDQGVYVVKIFDGEKWVTKKIVKK